MSLDIDEFKPILANNELFRGNNKNNTKRGQTCADWLKRSEDDFRNDLAHILDEEKVGLLFRSLGTPEWERLASFIHQI
ncbi:hypothetical protein ACTXT7_013692 [Hymenolepis weldensis]